jgi:hypothetical protein
MGGLRPATVVQLCNHAMLQVGTKKMRCVPVMYPYDHYAFYQWCIQEEFRFPSVFYK